MSPAHRSAPVLEPAPIPVPAPPHKPEGGSRKWLPILGLIILAGAVAAWFALRKPEAAAPPAGAPVAVRTAVATTGMLNRTIRVTGQTAATDYASVTAPMLRGPDANREMILLDVAASGLWVKKGTKIAQIDAQSLIDHVDDLADTIKTAEADIRKRQAEQSIEIENLTQTLRQTKADADKARLDYGASETQTEIQRQLLKLSLDEADARYKQAQADINDKKVSHAADVKILEFTLLRHTRHRDRHLNDLKAFTIFAPMDGLVVMQQIWRGSEMGQVQVGDRLSPGQPFMKVVNTKKMQVEGNVNQSESSNFRVGQTARIKLDAFGRLEFDGRVHSLGALAAGGYRQSYYVRTVPIRIQILGNDPRLIPDLSAGADVSIESAANQVMVPLSALSTDGAGKTIVQVKGPEKFDAREVTTGIRNETHVAIASGLKAGEVVRIN